MIFMRKKITRIFIILLCFALISGQSGFSQSAAVVDISSYLARQHGPIAISNFRPLHLRYLQLKQNEDSFKFLIDKGNSGGISQEDPKGLFKYFLVGLALPNDKFWVNLRPDSPSQIIDPLLAETDIGRILLEADLQLKKDIAQATHPVAAEGVEYWDKLYKKAGEIFGSENVTIPAITRPWIVPDEIIIKETPDSAYIYKATLKVMLEQDYLKNDAVYNFKDERLKQLNEYSSRLIRELIIPNLTRRINTSRKYSALRQVYYSLILSQWFKARFSGRKNAYSHLIDSKDLTDLISETPYSTDNYFRAYQRSFKGGEYSYQAPVYAPSGQTIRSYFSGGAELNLENVMPTQFGGIAGVNTNGPQVCIVASDQEQIDIKNNPYLLAAEGKISLGELVVRITGNSLSEGEVRKMIQGIEDAHRIEPDDGRNSYSFEGIREKAEILKEAGFDRRQRRDIMEYGLAGGKDGKRDNDKKVMISYFARLKDRLLNFIKGTPAKGSSEVKQLIEDADRQKGEKTKWSDRQRASVEQFRQSLSLLRQSFERYRSRPIEDTFKNMSWSARFATWFNATRKIIAETHKKIVVYYPGSAYDLLYPLLATNGDTFIFVDKDTPFRGEILNFIMSHQGEILEKKKEKDVYYLKFHILGKTRELYYYFGVDAGNENQLPGILKNGYNVYIERHFNANGYGGFTGDFNNLWRINLKYLAAKGFTITDYSLSLKEDISKSALHQIGYTQGHSPEDRSYYAGILDFNIYLPAPAVAGSPVMSQPDNAIGGIDFRSLPIVSQAVNNIILNTSHLSFANLTAMNLSQERQGIERLISSGISPSAERIKDYLQASCAKGEIEKDRDTLINYISAILRQEEEKCRHSETLLKDILIILEANSSSAELSRIFLGKPFNTPAFE